MRKTASVLFSLTLVATTLTAAHSKEAHRRGSRVYILHALNGSGEMGTVALKPDGANETVVEIHLMNAPNGVEQPAHIHMGSCAKIDPAPKYALDPVLDGTSDGKIDASIATLLQTPMAVNVHKSSHDLKDYVACADLTPKKE